MHFNEVFQTRYFCFVYKRYLMYSNDIKGIFILELKRMALRKHIRGYSDIKVNMIAYFNSTKN